MTDQLKSGERLRDVTVTRPDVPIATCRARGRAGGAGAD